MDLGGSQHAEILKEIGRLQDARFKDDPGEVKVTVLKPDSE